MIVPKVQADEVNPACRIASRPVETPERVREAPAPTTIPAPPEPERDIPRRRAPNPLPQREVRPTEDPKDIVPLDLYELDPSAASETYGAFPAEMKAHMQSALEKEVAQLKADLGTDDVARLQQEISETLARIALLERPHRDAINEIIRTMVDETYPGYVAKKLVTQITDQLPTRPEVPEASLAPSGQTPSLDPETARFYAYRRELYNLMSQASGWDGMRRFAFLYRDQINSLDPHLASEYQKIYKLHRLLNVEQLAHVPNNAFLSTSGLRDESSIGREIVTVTPERGIDEEGGEFIEVSEVKGIAAGVNGYALAHEAMKAGFEMSTALEATQRMPLSAAERQHLDESTNTFAAETRQGIYGPSLFAHFNEGLRLVYPNDPFLWSRFEGIFSLLNEMAFRRVIRLLSLPNLKDQPEQLKLLRKILDSWNV